MSDREDLKIRVNMVSAILVQFIKPIFEDDFPDKGMYAWLTDIQWCKRDECYKLYFDFSDFEEENDKYFKAEYHPNNRTAKLETTRKLFTAKEAGYYNPKYYVGFSLEGGTVGKRNDALFEKQILNYLQRVAA